MLCRPSIENTLKWDLPELKLGRNWESAGDFVPSTTEQHFNLALAWSTQGTMFICSMPVSMVKYCQRTLKHWTCIVIVILTLNCRSYVTPQIFFSLFLCEASKTDGWHLVMTSALLKCEGYFELDLLLCVVTYTVLECSACYLLTVHIIWKSTCTVSGFFFQTILSGVVSLCDRHILGFSYLGTEFGFSFCNILYFVLSTLKIYCP